MLLIYLIVVTVYFTSSLLGVAHPKIIIFYYLKLANSKISLSNKVILLFLYGMWIIALDFLLSSLAVILAYKHSLNVIKLLFITLAYLISCLSCRAMSVADSLPAISTIIKSDYVAVQID